MKPFEETKAVTQQAATTQGFDTRALEDGECRCVDNWMFDGVTYHGCAATPGEQPWCYVESATCGYDFVTPSEVSFGMGYMFCFETSRPTVKPFIPAEDATSSAAPDEENVGVSPDDEAQKFAVTDVFIFDTNCSPDPLPECDLGRDSCFHVLVGDRVREKCPNLCNTCNHAKKSNVVAERSFWEEFGDFFVGAGIAFLICGVLAMAVTMATKRHKRLTRRYSSTKDVFAPLVITAGSTSAAKLGIDSSQFYAPGPVPPLY